MWRVFLHPLVLALLLLGGALLWNWWRRSAARRRLAHLPPEARISLVQQILRTLMHLFWLFLRRF